MITRHEIAIGLYAAWRLFLRDASAIERFDDSISGVIKSFYCALVVLPGYVLLVGLSPAIETPQIGLFSIVLVNLIAYVAAWAVWPLVMHYLAPLIGRDEAYGRYIVAYNWANGPNILVAMLFGGPAMLGIGSPNLASLLDLAALAIMLLYHLFIVRTALRVPPLGAAGLVFGEFFVSQVIVSLRNAALF